jgi:hypothetical protein
MKKWIEEVIKNVGCVSYKVQGSALISPESYIGEGYYVGEYLGEEIIFHEDDVQACVE